MTGKKLGYVRVSTKQQCIDRQLDGIELDKIFMDRASAKDTARPQLQLLLEFIREDDHIFVHAMDRLARNNKDLLDLVDSITKKHVSITFISENLTFSGNDNPMSMLMLSMIGAFSQFENGIRKERQLEGIAIAKAKGKYKGRRKSLGNGEIHKMHTMLSYGATKASVARELGISRTAVYNYIDDKKLKKELHDFVLNKSFDLVIV